MGVASREVLKCSLGRRTRLGDAATGKENVPPVSSESWLFCPFLPQAPSLRFSFLCFFLAEVAKFYILLSLFFHSPAQLFPSFPHVPGSFPWWKTESELVRVKCDVERTCQCSLPRGGSALSSCVCVGC